MKSSNNVIIITYLIYIIFFEGFVLGGTGVLIVKYDWNPVWMGLAVFLGFFCYKPSQWNSLLNGKNPEPEQNHE